MGPNGRELDGDVDPNIPIGSFKVLGPKGYEMVSPNSFKGLLAIVKADLGLGNVDNTSDLNKVLSIPQMAAFTGLMIPVAKLSGSHIAGRVAGLYAMTYGSPLVASGIGSLSPIGIINIRSTDYPVIGGRGSKFKIKAEIFTNDVAPLGNFSFGLYPITRPTISGGTGLCIYTLGAIVTGSNGIIFTSPTADFSGTVSGADFSLPPDGFYAIGVTTTQTVAASALVHLQATLLTHY